jgi:hypothetical protein
LTTGSGTPAYNQEAATIGFERRSSWDTKRRDRELIEEIGGRHAAGRVML